MRMLLSAAIAAAVALPASAQSIIYTGGMYTQNFDGLGASGSATLIGRGPHALAGVLGSTGIDGWYGANLTGSSTDTEVRAQDGSLAGSTGRGVVSFGAGSSTERALGALPTSNQISSFGVLFVNNTGSTLTEVTISFTGEQWRRGDVTTPDLLTFGYGLGTSILAATSPFPALDFVSPNMQPSPTNVAINGNDPLNQSIRSGMIGGLSWTAGSTLAIVWTIGDISGQDNGLAIDGLTLSAVPTPGTTALLVLAGLAARRRRR